MKIFYSFCLTVVKVPLLCILSERVGRFLVVSEVDMQNHRRVFPSDLKSDFLIRLKIQQLLYLFSVISYKLLIVKYLDFPAPTITIVVIFSGF